MIYPRMVSIALRKYAAEPKNRAPAVRMLLRNAVRLCIAHLGKSEAEEIAFATINEAREQ